MDHKKLAVVSAIDVTIKVLLLAQIKAAQEAGYEVHGICSKGPNFDFLEKQGIRMYPIKIKRSISPFSDMRALWQMYRYFKSEKIGIVHTHTPKPSLLGQLAAKLAGIRVIVNTIHGFYFHENMKPFPKMFYVTMEKIAAKCSTMILSQNPEDIETAIKLKISKPEKLKCLGNGVNLERFNPAKFNDNLKAKRREKIGIPGECIAIGIIGRLVKEKGFLELFQAFKAIIDMYKNVWLVIIGSEEPEKTDRISGQTFAKYGIVERAVWLGDKEPQDIPELLSCLDVFVLPSWREGFPRSAIEAAAMGLPIVTTNIRGCRQVVEQEKNGILVPPKNVQALTEAIRRLIESKDLRDEMGRAGFEKAQMEFDENNVCRIVLDTYAAFVCEGE